MIILQFETPAERTVAELAAHARTISGDEFVKIDLSHRRVTEAIVATRGLCGDDGPRIPTWQGRCPVCAGYVEIMDEEWKRQMSVRRRLWSELQAM